MGAIDRIVQAVTGNQADTESGPSDAAGPAAASGDTSVPGGATPTQSDPASHEPDQQVSEGPSGPGNAETGLGGADSVPDTPDGVAEDFT